LPPILEPNHPMHMEIFSRRESTRLRHIFWRFVCTLCLFLSLPTLGQSPPAAQSPVDPLPQDTGTLGLKQMLLRLQTTARLMQTTAHPDDEDGGMLTLESRGKGATVLLLTLNRGEGGQNKVGSNLFDVLGVLRALELTASDRYYGVEQRFSRVADFGFSKNPEETFQKWQGHDIPLADMVRVIRTFRPDVLVARFSGTDRDGHGHHQASAILTREAFRAAADPNRFPEQIKEGLLPWQPKKLYVGNVCGFGASTCPAENYTVKLNTDGLNPALGMSYVQFAMEGLRHQLSQGAGGWSVDPGDRFTFYKLVDSVIPPTTDKDGHEKDFFDGIDTSLPGLASRLGAEEAKVPWLRGELVKIGDDLKQATEKAEKDPTSAAGPLYAALDRLRSVRARMDESEVDRQAKEEVLGILDQKQRQAQTALNLAMNVSLEATVSPPMGPQAGLPGEQDALTVVSPGQRLTVIAKLHNGSRNSLTIQNAELESSAGWVKRVYADQTTIAPGEDYYANFAVQVPADAPFTRPYWHRDNPETDAVNTVDDEIYETLAFPPSPLHVRVRYEIAPRRGIKSPVPDVIEKLHTRTASDRDNPEGEISAGVLVPFADDKGVQRKRALAVAPAFSVMLEPGTQTIRVEGDPGCHVTVAVSSNLSTPAKGTLRLQVPPSWRVEPSQLPVEFHHRGEKQDFHFKVFPASLKEGRAEVRAVLESGGVRYGEGYTAVTREDLDTFYYYQPAVQRVSIVDVKVPNDLKVGYIMGAGDDIPTVLQQIGMDVTLIPADKIAGEDLSRYGTIVLGIRAYDTEKDVTTNNKKLLDYVSAGGTLIVQYNTGVSDFNGGHFTPYPAQLSRARVSVEEAPVEILAPDDGVFHYPNQITQHDFGGWVQERGLYFMDQWDSKFKPLLACQDPGEPSRKGGLLQTQYGKGTYIYTGYAFFRQLPAGVPGAIRLYVNLLSAGHEKQAAVAGRSSLVVGHESSAIDSAWGIF
jgi:LmbE family N-acetylglucosaminyl deacetylase